MTRKRGEKRTACEREQHLAEIARMDRRGMTAYQMSQALNIGEVTLRRDLKELKNRYRTESRDEVATMVIEKYHQYREVRSEAWSAWERSREDGVRRTTEVMRHECQCPMCKGTTRLPGKERSHKDADKCPGCKGTGKLEKITKEIESRAGQCGDPRFLQVVLNCLEAERRLFGLDPTEEVDTTTTVQLNWEELFRPRPAVLVSRAEQQILEVEAVAAQLAQGEGEGK